MRGIAAVVLAFAACGQAAPPASGNTGSSTMTTGLTTRDQAYAIALAAVQAAHPDIAFALRDETTGGGRTPPWAFLILPASTRPGDQIPGLGPVVVEYGTGKVEFLGPRPRPLKAIVADWEIAKYGVRQR